MSYEENYVAPFFLGTQTGTLSLAYLVDALLLSSEHQLQAVDAGIAALAEHGLGWVITQYQITINQMPQTETPLILGTAARTYNKLMTYRDYWVKDQAGHTLASMSGAWVMMDLKTRKLAPIQPEFPKRAGAEFDTHVVRYPRQTPVVHPTIDVPYRVRYFDIDGNGHVNNTHYFEWMADSLGADFLRSHQLTHVDIKYAREVTYGSTPHAQAELDGHTTRHQIVTDGVINAQATMTWQG